MQVVSTQHIKGIDRMWCLWSFKDFIWGGGAKGESQKMKTDQASGS